MSKGIKITDKCLKLIHKYQGPRETYSQVIERAFAGLEALNTVSRSVYEPRHLPELDELEVK